MSIKVYDPKFRTPCGEWALLTNADCSDPADQTEYLRISIALAPGNVRINLTQEQADAIRKLMEPT